jgi:hypothetical protein
MQVFKDHRDAMWVYSDYLVFDESGVPLPDFPRPTAHPEGSVFDHIVQGEISLPVMSVTIHRKVFEEAGGFNPALGYGADLDFWLKVSVRYPLVFVPKAESVLTEHAGRIVRRVSTRTKSLAWYSVLKSNASSKEFPPERRMQLRRSAIVLRGELATMCHEEAYRFLLAGQSKESRAALRLAISFRPSYWKNYVYYLFTLLPASVYAVTRALKQRVRT